MGSRRKRLELEQGQSYLPEFNYDINDLEFLKKKGVYWWGVPWETGVGMALTSYKKGSETTRQGEQYSKIISFNPAIGMINPDDRFPRKYH